MNDIRRIFFVCSIAAVFQLAGPLPAQVEASAPLPELRVPRIGDASIGANGFPLNRAWDNAARADLWNPWPYRPVEETTEVYVLHSDEALYVAFVCEDRELVSTHLNRDDQTFRDDCAELLLGAPVDGELHEGLNIEVNASGAWADVLFRWPNWLNYDWNPSGIMVRAQPIETGWRVEIVVPFESIAFVKEVRGYDSQSDPSMKDFEQCGQALDRPARLRANFARWHRPENALSVWSDPQWPSPHAVIPNRYGWLVFDSSATTDSH